MQQTLTISMTPDELKEIIRDIFRDELRNNSNDHYLTRGEAAQFLKITLPTLHTWTKCGKIKAHPIGGRVLYLKNDLINVIK